MPRFLPEPAHRHDSIARTGVLLINLGTPEAPNAKAVRTYLKEFLSDPRVVEVPRLLWWLILNGVILNTRPKKSAAKYAQIWTKEGSPLKIHTERQAKLVRGLLGERVRAPFSVVYAMRYGAPSIASGLAELKKQNCDRILLLPLYPQYAASSTASALDKAFDILRAMRNMPEIRVVKHFHDHPAYIAALAQSVRDYWMQNGRPEKLVMSFHGVPRFSLDKGDPYHCECHKTGRLLAEALGLSTEQYTISFQSRFGRAEWLKPYTVQTLQDLGKRGVKRVDVICPGFIADCLETLEEISLEAKASFIESGGSEFHYIPCLNQRDDWIAALCDIVEQHVQGWLPTEWRADMAQAQGQNSEARAIALGAKL